MDSSTDIMPYKCVGHYIWFIQELLGKIFKTTYSFTGDGDPIFIHLSFLSLFHLHLIQQSLLNAQAAHEESILPSIK